MNIFKKKSKLSKIGMFLALFSAFVSAFNIIVEKKYIEYISSESVLFLMYLGAGIGLIMIHLFSKNSKKIKQNKITKNEVPKIIVIVICELVASLLIIESLKLVNAGLVSLLLVFEIIMTSLFAYLIFNDPIENNEIASIILIVIGFIVLNFNKNALSSVNLSSMFVIGACVCWGIENNVTGLISEKEPAFFTSIKCFAVAALYLIICLINGSLNFSFPILLIYGFLSYGLGMITYALSTRSLGANKATLIFSFNPIFGAILALLIYKEEITGAFFVSLLIMILAILCLNKEEKK